MPRKQTVEQVIDRIKNVHRDQIKLDTSTYAGMHIKARFIDVDFGEWLATPGNVINNRSGHPKRGKIKTGQKKRLTLNEVKSRLKKKHGDTVVIVDSTYVSADNKACFVDKDYGEWTAQVKSVIAGRRHTDYKYVNFSKSRQMSHDEFVLKLKEVHGDVITVCEEYTNSHKKTKFLDKRYGEWNCMPYSVLAGHNHPMRGQSNRAKKMRFSMIVIHWKTNEELVCVGSYEVAFVNWCNKNHVDFDWQVPFESFGDKTYIIDAYIKSGRFQGTYIEIKGVWMQDISRQKWEYFHKAHINSQLWDNERLTEIGIL